MEYPRYDPQSPVTPLQPAELDGLDRLLQKLPTDGAMSLDGADGFFTALLAGPPELLASWPTADWLPWVWGGDGPLGHAEATPFASNPLAIVAAPNHALVRRRQLPFSALADYKFVVREEGSGTRAAMERLFAQHKTALHIEMEMPSNETIKQAVMAGMGLSFLSMRTLRHELASGHIALVDVQGLPPPGHWYVTHLRQKKLSPAARSFKEFLIEQGGALMDSWS